MKNFIEERGRGMIRRGEKGKEEKGGKEENKENKN